MFFIKLLLFILSFVGILWLIFKKIPQLSQIQQTIKGEEKELSFSGKKFIDLETIEKNLSSFLEKLFRRIKIFSLKLENFSTKLSKRFQERKKIFSEPKRDYWEKLGNHKSSIREKPEAKSLNVNGISQEEPPTKLPR